jgi:hypothetical protein
VAAGCIGLRVASDVLITLAYFSIPFTLIYFVRNRKDLQFHWIFLCFAVFIMACGTTHLMEIRVIWHPTCWLSGGIKALTALASVRRQCLWIVCSTSQPGSTSCAERSPSVPPSVAEIDLKPPRPSG